MRIRVQHETDLRVPKRLHDGPRIDALSQEKRGSGVPQIVKPHGRKVRVLQWG